MTDVFRLDLLPAREGDCLVLTWGDDGKPRRMMVDTGRKATYRAIRRWLAGLPEAERTFELLVVSHVDRDHIEGVVEMMSDPARPISFRDVWFNGYHHLLDDSVETFGPVQGEQLSELLLAPGGAWNARFRGRSVETARVRKPIELADGLRLTLLGPDRSALAALVPDWDKECREAGLVRGTRGWRRPVPRGIEAFGGGPIDVEALAAAPFIADSSTPNATSIAVLAEYAGRRVLLAADAGADRLAASIRPLADAQPARRLPLAAMKLPHHGSGYNLSAELLDLVTCPIFAVSSNGSYFHHPHDEALARILTHADRPELVFNYRSPETLAWDDDDRRTRYRYRTRYPTVKANGTISVDLLA